MRSLPSVALTAFYVLAGIVLMGCTVRLEPKGPPAGRTPVALDTVEPSWIAIQVRADLQPAFEFIENSVARTVGPDQAWTNGDGYDFKYRIERSPFNMDFRDNELRIASEIKYAVRIRRGIHKRQCGCSDEAWCGGNDEPRRRMRVALQSRLAWDPEYFLRARTEVVPNVPHNSCQFDLIPLVWEVDATSSINRAFRSKLTDLAQRHLDERIAEVTNVKRSVAKAWEMLFEAQPLSNAPTSWLQVRPSRVVAAPLRGSGTAAETNFAIVAEPLVTVGGRPNGVVAALPPLETGAPGEAFHVATKVEVPYRDAGAILTQSLKDRRFPPVGRRHLYVRKVQVYGSEKKNHAVIRAEVTGSAEGVLFLEGSLVYNGATEEIMLGDVDYTLETRNAIARIADWFAHDFFREQVRDAGRFSIREPLRLAKEGLAQALNRPLSEGVRLSGAITNIEVRGIGLTDDALLAQIKLDGSARITFE